MFIGKCRIDDCLSSIRKSSQGEDLEVSDTPRLSTINLTDICRYLNSSHIVSMIYINFNIHYSINQIFIRSTQIVYDMLFKEDFLSSYFNSIYDYVKLLTKPLINHPDLELEFKFRVRR